MTSTPAHEAVSARFGDAVTGHGEFRGELTISVRPDAIRDVCAFCHSDLGFDMLLDISSVDHPERNPRFDVVYELYSLRDGAHLRLKTTADEDDPKVISVIGVWPGADWHEREVWDMMGIRFEGHPDLRRIIMWEGYPFHPLRKDFPLEGERSDVPGVAFTEPAPLAGGPFVTAPVEGTTQVREPRARHAGDHPADAAFLAEP